MKSIITIFFTLSLFFGISAQASFDINFAELCKQSNSHFPNKTQKFKGNLAPGTKHPEGFDEYTFHLCSKVVTAGSYYWTGCTVQKDMGDTDGLTINNIPAHFLLCENKSTDVNE